MDAIFDTPVGKLQLVTENGFVTELQRALPSQAVTLPQDTLCKKVIAQLQRYFTDSSTQFDLPLQPRGTSFQKCVWKILQTIPVGQTRTYGELATQLNTGPRAVGNACRRNPITIIIPCHRIIATDGGLGGYAGHQSGKPLQTKRWLLNHEIAP